MCKSNEAIYGKGAKWTCPEESVLAEHVAEKHLRFGTCNRCLEEKLKENEQFELYQDLELPLAAIFRKNGKSKELQ